MKALKTLLIVVVLLLSLLGITVIFLPRILSTNPARRAILAKLSRMSGKTVEVESWSLTWRDGMEMRGVAYADAGGETAFKAAEIKSTSGLMDLLSSRKDLGTVEIMQPDLRLTPSKRAVPAPAPEAPEQRPVEPPTEAPPPAPIEEPAPFPDIRGTLVVRGGRFVFAPPETHPPLVLQDLDARLELTSTDAPLAFQITARQLVPGGESRPDAGALNVKGSARLTRDGRLNLAQPTADIEVRLEAVDMAPFSTLVGAYADAPRMKGSLTGAASIRLDGLENISAKGEITARELEMTGGPFGDDRPVFDEVSVAADVRVDAEGLAIERLAARAPFGVLEARGRMQTRPGETIPQGALSGSMEIDLAKLAQAFPGTLKVREGLRVTAGKASVEGEARSGDKGLDVTALLRVRDLTGLREKETLTLDSPLTLLVKGQYGEQGPAIENLQLDASFGQLSGSGSRKEMKLSASLDVSGALVEVKKFVDIGKTSLGGQLTANVQAREAEPGRIAASVDAVWKGFEFAGESLKISEPEVTLGVEGDVVGDNMVLRSLALGSRPISIRGAGSLNDWKESRILNLTGTLTPDFALLGEMFLPSDGVKVTLEGKTPGPCKIMIPLGAGDDPLLTASEVEALLRLSRLTFMGIDARDVEANLNMRSGRVRAALTARLNEGALSLAPIFDLSGDQPVVTITEKTQVLDDVQLTDEMMSEMMSMVNPVLRTSGVTNGTLDLVLEPCRLPLGKAFKKEAAFKGSVGFQNVALAPAGTMLEVLQLLRLDPHDLAISNGTVSVVCEDGWVETTPLTLVSGRYSMRMSGRMSLDGPLRYTAEVPITEKMVGASTYEHVKGIYLKLPIGGTVAQPRISAESFLALVKSAVKDAGVKVVVDEGKQLLNKFLKKLEEKQKEKSEPAPSE